MSAWLSRGSLVDVAIAAIVLEALLLLVYRRRTGRGLAPLDVFGQLLAGAILLVAVRLAVTGAPTELVLLALALSFPAHVFDLLRRFRSANGQS
ncbi:MAG: hypothetical protein AAF447_06990 [Myxococcota bacterium]